MRGQYEHVDGRARRIAVQDDERVTGRERSNATDDAGGFTRDRVLGWQHDTDLVALRVLE